MNAEDLERLDVMARAIEGWAWTDDVLRLTAALRSVMADLDETHADLAHTSRELEKARAELRSVMAERDRAESHAKRAETLAHDLQAQVLALRSLFVNFRWDGPAWIKPEEHRAMEEANRLAGGKPLDA